MATGLRPRQAAIEGAAALTPRQRQVCELAAAGKGNRAIAQELFLSIKTVETHLAAGYRKLGVSARAELAAELAQLGTVRGKVQGRPPIVRAAPARIVGRDGTPLTTFDRCSTRRSLRWREAEPHDAPVRARRSGASPSSPGALAVPAGPSRAVWPAMAWPWPSTTAAIRIWPSRSSTPSAATAGWPRRSPGTSRTSARRPSSPPRSPTAWARSRCWCSTRPARSPRPPLALVAWEDHVVQLERFVKGPVVLGRALLPGMAARRSGAHRAGRLRGRGRAGARQDRLRDGEERAERPDPQLGARARAAGITVNAVAPGVLPFERHAREEIAHALSFIASEAASFITGQRIVVDGRGPAD